MNNQVTRIEEAIAILTPNIIAHLSVYQVNRGPHESSVLPLALCTNPEELRALAFVINLAKVNAELLAACELAHEAMSDRYDGVEDSTTLWMGESMQAMENAIRRAKGAA